MGYAAIALAAAGFVVGIMFRLQVLLLVVATLFLLSIVVSLGSEFSFLDSLLMVMGTQTVVQGSYFLGLLMRAAFTTHDMRHI
ncbi:hypothetical protein [Bradyrhizobium sp. NP1]|jgi:hypothetical protein|uniref:hypothetical protein n=1 Tax=Bradyrhizobium sp. NP1 TaxID=3049772 RepID=UPI0025A57ABD|nr:hypothetical protein [Bradyrhizobium sp. NP1]WJR81392.1 hypothetical protein QOU61_17065 [Bradyrhizobium sp. NP1]